MTQSKKCAHPGNVQLAKYRRKTGFLVVASLGFWIVVQICEFPGGWLSFVTNSFREPRRMFGRAELCLSIRAIVVCETLRQSRRSRRMKIAHRFIGDHLLDASALWGIGNAEGVCKFQPWETPWKTNDLKSNGTLKEFANSSRFVRPDMANLSGLAQINFQLPRVARWRAQPWAEGW